MELIRPNDKLSISINQENPLWCASGSNLKVFTTPAINLSLSRTGQGPTFKQSVISAMRNI